jgi:hypothetical protein
LISILFLSTTGSDFEYRPDAYVRNGGRIELPRPRQMRATNQCLYHGPSPRATRALALLAIVVASGAGCGGRPAVAAPAPIAPTPLAPIVPLSAGAATPVFVAGETMTFEVTFRGIEGGRARVAVGEPSVVDGRRVLPLRAEAESAGLLATFKEMHDDLSSWVDAGDARPVKNDSAANVTGKPRRVLASFAADGSKVELDITVGDKTRHAVKRLPAGPTYDPLGALLLMRGWRAPAGSRAGFFSLGGQRLWQNELVVAGSETIKTPLGRFACTRIDGTSVRMISEKAEERGKAPRKFTVWITDDERRVPVRIRAHTELGDVDVTATSYDVLAIAAAP